MTKIHFAPLQGYADHIYRRLHSEIYGGINCYYTPFIRIEKGEPRRQDISRLIASKDDGTNLIPQIIFSNVDEFVTLRDAVKDCGYDHIDLNLGCPYPMQTNKGRGAELLRHPDTVEAICDLIKSDQDTRYSIKMRIGVVDDSEWVAIIGTLNNTPLSHITLHPRVAKQIYSGDLNTEAFDDFVSKSTNPVVWNGEIRSISDIESTLRNHPAIAGVMIGRGLLSRPSLAIEYVEGTEWSRERRLSTLREFYDRLLDEYQQTLCGDAQILQKIKPQWEYLEDEIGHKAYKGIKKATNIARYKEAVSVALEV